MQRRCLANDCLRSGHFIANFCPRCCFAKGCGEANRVARRGFECDAFIGNGNRRTVPRSEVQIGQHTAGYLDSIFTYNILNIIAVEVNLLKFILNPELALFHIKRQDVERLINALHIEALCRRCTICQDDAIAAEASVVRIVAKVAAISPVILIRFARNGHPDALVFPVPHELANHCRIRFVDVPEVINLVAHRVTHSMGVLALDVRPLSSLSHTTLSRREHVAIAAVHRARDVAPLAVSLIMRDARGVERLDGLHDALEVIAASTLVSGTPTEDANMIAKGADLPLVALHHWLAEEFNAAQARVSVTFHICFGKDVEPILVAKLVEIGIVWIVARTDRIHIQPLHRQDVLQHLFSADSSTRLLTKVVTVNPMNHKTFAINEQSAIRADAYRTEANLAGSHIDQRSVGRQEAKCQVVEFRTFCAPAFHTRKREGLANVGSGRERPGRFLHHVCPVANRHLQLHAAWRTTFQGNIQLRLSGSSVSSKPCRLEEEVANSFVWSRPEIDVTRNARQPPIVLTLEERAARKAINLHGDIVLALANEVADVEIARQIRVLGIAHELPIHPNIVAVTCSVEADESLPRQPTLGKCESATIASDGVLHLFVIGIIAWTRGHYGVIARIGKGITRIDVEGLVPALAVSNTIHLPGHRNSDVVPTAHVVVVGIETTRNLAWQSAPTEFPGAVQVEEVRRAGQIQRAGIVNIVERNAEVVTLDAVQTRDADIVPLHHRLRMGDKRDKTKQKQQTPFHCCKSK